MSRHGNGSRSRRRCDAFIKTSMHKMELVPSFPSPPMVIDTGCAHESPHLAGGRLLELGIDPAALLATLQALRGRPARTSDSAKPGVDSSGTDAMGSTVYCPIHETSTHLLAECHVVNELVAERRRRSRPDSLFGAPPAYEDSFADELAAILEVDDHLQLPKMEAEKEKETPRHPLLDSFTPGRHGSSEESSGHIGTGDDMLDGDFLNLFPQPPTKSRSSSFDSCRTFGSGTFGGGETHLPCPEGKRESATRSTSSNPKWRRVLRIEPTVDGIRTGQAPCTPTTLHWANAASGSAAPQRASTGRGSSSAVTTPTTTSSTLHTPRSFVSAIGSPWPQASPTVASSGTSLSSPTTLYSPARSPLAKSFPAPPLPPPPPPSSYVGVGEDKKETVLPTPPRVPPVATAPLLISSPPPRAAPVAQGAHLERQTSAASGSLYSSGGFSSSSFNESVFTPPLHPFLPLQPVPTNDSQKGNADRRLSCDSGRTGPELAPSLEGDCASALVVTGGSEKTTWSLPRKLSITPSVAPPSMAPSKAPSIGAGSSKSGSSKVKGERALLDQPHTGHRLAADKGNFVDGCPVCERMAGAWQRRRDKAAAGRKGRSLRQTGGKGGSSGDVDTRSSVDTNDSGTLSRTTTATSAAAAALASSRSPAAPEMPPLPASTGRGSVQPHRTHIEDANRGTYHTSCAARPRLAAAGSQETVEQKQKAGFGWGRGRKPSFGVAAATR